MDTEAYLLARHQIQDRLAAQRQQVLPKQGANGASVETLPWWPVVARWLVRDARWHSLFSGIVTAGAGYALSRLANRFGLNRFRPTLITRLGV